MPLQICSAKRAFVLMFKRIGRAMSPDFQLHDFESWIELGVPDGEPYVRTASLRIRMPEVVVLANCDRFLRPRVAFSRRNLFRRDQYTCQYCGKQGSADDLSIDHVIPRASGGSGTWTNCVVACRRCNERKADRTLKQVGMRLLKQPEEPPAHLAFTTYVGRQKSSWVQFIRGG